MALEVKDLAGLSEPATKLIDVVSSAIGTLYKPRAIRNEAAAKADEIRLLSLAHAEAEEQQRTVALEAALQRIRMISDADPDLAARAKNRLLVREIEGQVNVEAIADHALAALPDYTSKEPVSADWRRKFFMEAENICEADMQMIWGKVLAGEVTSPGTFSLRTLDALRYLSREDAELFRRACRVAMQEGWIAILNDNINTALMPYGISYGDIITLRDAGLVADGDHIHKDFTRNPTPTDPAKHRVLLVNNGELIELSGPGLLSLKLPALLFTRVGRELQRLIDREAGSNYDYLKTLGIHLRARSVTAKIGRPISRDGINTVMDFVEELANLPTSAP